MARHSIVNGVVVPFTAEQEAARDAEEAAATSAVAAQVAAAAAVAYRRARAVAYRDQLGKEAGDYTLTEGDVLDTLITQVESMRQAAGVAATADWSAMLGKIAAIKAANPKPS